MSADSGVRRARVEDDVLPVIRAAFGDEGEKVGNLWAELEQSDALRASLVAEQDGQIVGHVGLSHAWLDARRELVDVWVLSPLSVVPDQQRRGIGTRLLAAAVDAARAGETPLLFLEGDPGYYGAPWVRERQRVRRGAAVGAYAAPRVPGDQVRWVRGLDDRAGDLPGRLVAARLRRTTGSEAR